MATLLSTLFNPTDTPEAVAHAGVTLGALTGVPFAIVILAIGVIAFTSSLAALRHMNMPCAISRVILAACTALLSIIGLVGTFGAPMPTSAESLESSPIRGVISGILVPYAALGATLTILGLILIITRIRKRIERFLAVLRQDLKKPTNGFENNAHPTNADSLRDASRTTQQHPLESVDRTSTSSKRLKSEASNGHGTQF